MGSERSACPEVHADTVFNFFLEKHAENAHVQHASTANQKMTKSEAARFVAAGERAAGLAAVQNAEDALLERPIVASHN